MTKKKQDLSCLYIIGISVVLFSILKYCLKTTQKSIDEENTSVNGDIIIFNTNKNVYNPGETVYIGISSIDKKGDTQCHNYLIVDIKYPSGENINLSTKNGSIEVSGTCDEENNVTNEADYRASFSPVEEGIYEISLTNLDTGNKFKDQVVVGTTEEINIERHGAIRINPEKSDRYPMTLNVTASEDFSGMLVEKIPKEFEIMWLGGGKLKDNIEYKTITWEVNLTKGESKEFVYTYKAPKISPAHYTLGYAQIFSQDTLIFEESKYWNIVSDAVKFYLPSSGSSPVSPAYDANWDDTSLGSRLLTGTAPSSTTMTYISLNGNADTNDTDYLYGQWISPGLEAQTISAQTLKFQIRAMQENDRCNQVTAISVRAVSNDGSTVTGTILSLTRDNTEIATSTTTPVNRQFSATTSALSINSGDRLVIEIGTGGNPDTGSGGNSHDADLRIGDNGGTDLPENDSDTNDYNPWVEFTQNLTFQTGSAISGTVYTDEAKSSNMGSGKTIALYVNGTSKGTYETNSNGQYSFSGISGISTDDTIIVYIDGETENGSAITLASGPTMAKSDFDIITDRLIVQSETMNAVTNGDLDDVDSVDGENDDGITIASGELTVASGFELFIPTGEEFAPGNNVSTEKIHVKGTYTADSETLTITGSGTGACSASQATTLPLCLDSGSTFTYSTGTVVYTGNSNSTIENGTFNNLSMTPTITSGVTYNLEGAITLYGDMAINPTSASSNELTVNLGGNITAQDDSTLAVYATTSATSNLNTTGTNYNITTGYMNIGAGGEVTANGSTITLTGYTSPVFTRTGTFTADTSTVRFSTGDYTSCGGRLFIEHTTAGNVAPVDKSVYYKTVYTDLSGEYACWLAQNLGATDQASSVTDSYESSAGWYWQFNRKQGYIHDGVSMTPDVVLEDPVNDNSDWVSSEDPCTLELGSQWRIPTETEMSNIDTNWESSADSYNSVLKIHPAGYLTQLGTLIDRGSKGMISTATQQVTNKGYYLYISSIYSHITVTSEKAYPKSLRCLTQDSQQVVNLSLVSGNTTFYNVEIQHNGAETVSASNLNISENFTLTAGTLDTTTSNYPITTKNLSISEGAELIANASVINVTGNWTNSGIFTYDTSTVNFNGSGAQQISGDTTFYDLNISATTPRTVTIVSPTIISIPAGGSVIFEGEEDNLLTLVPDTTAAWYLQVDQIANVSVCYTDVAYSDASDYKTIYAADGTSIDSGNNENWIFSWDNTCVKNIKMEGIKFDHIE